jgi:translocation and assembly module TamA
MRFIVAGICTLLALCCLPAARAADPQSYKVDLASTGFDAIDSTLRASSILVSLRSSAPVSPYGLIARARGDLDRLKTVLESYGYYQSNVTIKIDGLALNDPALAAELEALPKKRDAQVQVGFAIGPLYHVRRVTIDGELPPSAQGILPLKSGAPAVASDVLNAGVRLLSALEDQGYAFAKVDPPVAYEDATNPVLDVSYHVETGPRVNIGEIHFEGLKRVHEKFLRRRLLLHTGEQYRASAVEHARSDLLSLGVFAEINVRLGTEVDGSGGVPITFRVREGLRRTIGFTAAYSTDLGGSGGITWSNKNLFGNAEQLQFAASVINAGGNATNGIGYDTSLKYILQDVGRRDQSLQFAVGAVKQSLQAYDQTAQTASVNLKRKLNMLWSVSAGVTYTNEEILQVGVARHYTLVALPLNATYDTTGLISPLDDPTHGLRGSLTVAPTHSIGNPSATFVVNQLYLATYFDLDHWLPTDPGRSVLAARATVGAAAGSGSIDLPPDQRFYAGGSTTVRGYAYQSVGPTFPAPYSDIPMGGTEVVAGTLEFRQRIGRSWGASLFVDVGQVSNKLQLFPLFPGGASVGVGAGVRYYTPIGPIRLDVAVPTKYYASDYAPFQIYIGLGPAF